MADEVVFESIKKTYPIMFDDTVIPFYPTWNRSVEKIEDTQTSEGGTQIAQLIHVGRKSYQFTIAVADDAWVQIFEEFNELDSFSLKIYSPRLHGYETVTVRMTNYTCNPVRHSEELTAVAGVWNVSFTLEGYS